MMSWRIVPRRECDILGEGTLWSARDNAIYWVDILAPALNRYTLGNKIVDRWVMPEPLGWIVERRAGGFIAGFQSGFAELDLEPFAIRPIVNPESALPGNRMNDGKADAFGNIWCGTMDVAESVDTGALYCFFPDRTWRVMDSPYRIPNGPAFSTDDAWLYHSDTARQTIYRFARRPDGTLGKRDPFIVFGEIEGYPDGMTVDAAGGLWVAHWGGSCVSRFFPDGALDFKISLPTHFVTSITFAGEQLDRIFISSAALDQRSENDGALFEVFANARGCPPGLFAG